MQRVGGGRYRPCGISLLKCARLPSGGREAPVQGVESDRARSLTSHPGSVEGLGEGKMGSTMREELYALCTPDGQIYQQAVLGFVASTGVPLRGMAFYTKEDTPTARRDVEAHRDLNIQVRAVGYDEASAALAQPSRVPSPRV